MIQLFLAICNHFQTSMKQFSQDDQIYVNISLLLMFTATTLWCSICDLIFPKNVEISAENLETKETSFKHQTLVPNRPASHSLVAGSHVASSIVLVNWGPRWRTDNLFITVDEAPCLTLWPYSGKKLSWIDVIPLNLSIGNYSIFVPWCLKLELSNLEVQQKCQVCYQALGCFLQLYHI